MDGRRWAAAVVLCTIAGCSSLSGNKPPGLTSLPTPKTHYPEAGQATVSKAMSTVDRRNEPVKPSTYVALAQYREQIASNPELSFAEAEQVRAQVRQAYHEAIKADPKCTAAYVGLAKTFVNADDAPQALAMYGKALEVVPNDPNLWFEKGLTHARFKDFDGALTSMQRAAQLDPDNRLYARSLGLTLARSGRFDEARGVLARCMKPDEMHYTLARMHRHLGQIDQARGEVALALHAQPGFTAARQLAAEIGEAGAVQTVGYQEPAAPRVQVGGIE